MVSSRAWGFLGLFAVAVASSTAQAGAHWWDYARRFTGENDKVRENAIAELRKMPDLRAELKKALGTTEHFLALDVIQVLDLKGMTNDLLAFAEKDKTGYSYHVLNSLLEPKDYARVGQIYLERLDLPKTAPAAKMAILDSAARMELTLGGPRTERLLRDDSPEVRSSVLSLFRNELLRRNYQRGLDVLEKTIADPTFQIRIQTLFLVSELPPSLRRANLGLIDGVLAKCKNDPNVSVKALCATVTAEADQ